MFFYFESVSLKDQYSAKFMSRGQALFHQICYRLRHITHEQLTSVVKPYFNKFVIVLARPEFDRSLNSNAYIQWRCTFCRSVLYAIWTCTKIRTFILREYFPRSIRLKSQVAKLYEDFVTNFLFLKLGDSSKFDPVRSGGSRESKLYRL